jgi:hypothetical protein
VREVIEVSDGDLTVRVIADFDSDDEGLTELAGRLREELLTLDVDSVDPLPDEDIPEHAKGLGAVAGWLSVHLGSASLRSVVRTVRDWAARTNNSVEVSIGKGTLKLGNATAEQQEQIVEAWLARYAGSA